MLLEGPQTYQTDVEGESHAFDEIRELAEAHGAAPGKSFITELDLRESLGEIVVEHMYVEFGQLEIDEDAKHAWAELIENSLPITVRARIWTSPDWEDDFYASVKVDLLTVEEAAAQADAALKAHMVETYGTDEPTVEQLLHRHEEVEREPDEALAEASRPAVNPYGAAAPTPAPASPPWFELLAPDGTPRATPWQRGYVRGKIGKHFPENRAPRMDFITVGQAHRVAQFFGVDPAPLTQSGRGSMALFVVALVLLNLAMVPLVFVGVGVVFFVVELVFFVWYFRSRARLQPPFGRQPGQ